MTVALTDSSGRLITSYSEVWKDKSGRPVYAWRCDKGEPAHDFETPVAARAFFEQVYGQATPKERREAGWRIVADECWGCGLGDASPEAHTCLLGEEGRLS